MSFDAITWALQQPVGKSSAKFVLVAMASCCNGEGAAMTCWPSVKFLAETTAQDRKTVMDNIRRLREEGFLHDTGERRGATGQISVYLLKSPETGTVTATTTRLQEDGNSTETGTAAEASKSTKTGTGTENGTVPLFPPNSPVFPSKESRFSLERVPKTGHGIRNGISNGTSNGIRKGDAPAPDLPGVPPNLLADFLAVRKAKRAGPLTATAIAGLTREAAKAGLTLLEAVTFCCEAGWQAFNAGWYENRTKGNGHAKPNGRHRGFDHVDYEEGLTNGVPDA